MKRIKYVLKKFKKKYKEVFFSIDTRKSFVMNKGIKYGADIINDVSGFNFDDNALNILKKSKVSKVIHHMQGIPGTMQLNPKYKNVLLDIYDFLKKVLKIELKMRKLS